MKGESIGGRRALTVNAAGVAVWLMALAVWLMMAAAPVRAAMPLPDLAGRITDGAGLITAEDRIAIEAVLNALEAKSTDQVAVVTVPSLGGYAIEEFGIELARKWGIGQKGKDNGILLIVAPNERRVRIEVGRRLESQMTDALSKLIIENGILPRFRRGDFSGGIRAGVQDINDVLLGDADAVAERARISEQPPETDYVFLIILCIWVAIVVYSIYQQQKQARQLPQDVRRRRRRFGDDGGIVILPGGSGGWSGGRGGGGWSGGGGSFGGGGSSGSW